MPEDTGSQSGDRSTYLSSYDAKIINMSDAFPLLVATDLRNWGTGLRFFADVFAYNLLSATKFVNELVEKGLRV
ncbi:MAG: hypothetical protein U9N36_09525 [Euryarchaeota archaeon]|nr:hypothetical protein [Euryarchaeota archaeon]